MASGTLLTHFGDFGLSTNTTTFHAENSRTNKFDDGSPAEPILNVTSRCFEYLTLTCLLRRLSALRPYASSASSAMVKTLIFVEIKTEYTHLNATPVPSPASGSRNDTCSRAITAPIYSHPIGIRPREKPLRTECRSGKRFDLPSLSPAVPRHEQVTEWHHSPCPLWSVS